MANRRAPPTAVSDAPARPAHRHWTPYSSFFRCSHKAPHSLLCGVIDRALGWGAGVRSAPSGTPVCLPHPLECFYSSASRIFSGKDNKLIFCGIPSKMTRCTVVDQVIAGVAEATAQFVFYSNFPPEARYMRRRYQRLSIRNGQVPQSEVYCVTIWKLFIVDQHSCGLSPPKQQGSVFLSIWTKLQPLLSVSLVDLRHQGKP